MSVEDGMKMVISAGSYTPYDSYGRVSHKVKGLYERGSA
jgi:hypothetical protein